MLDLFFNPVKYFDKVKDKEIKLWLPIIILFLIGIFDSIVNTIIIDNTTINDVIQGTFPVTTLLYNTVISNLSFYLIIALQTILFPLIIKKLGGTGGSRKHSFYILGLASLPILIQSIIHLFFPSTILWQYFEENSIMFFLTYTLFNFFNIWSVALLIIGFARVYNVSYKKSSVLYLQFLLKLIPLIILTFLAN